MGITQLGEPPLCWGAHSQGFPGCVSRGEGIVGSQSTGKPHLWDCPTWLVEMGCTGKGKGMNRTFSQLQAVPQMGGLLFLHIPQLHPLLWGPGVRLLVPQVTRGEQSPRVLLPVPATSLPVAVPRAGVPRGDVAALRGALCCCARRWRVAPSR